MKDYTSLMKNNDSQGSKKPASKKQKPEGQDKKTGCVVTQCNKASSGT